MGLLSRLIDLIRLPRSGVVGRFWKSSDECRYVLIKCRRIVIVYIVDDEPPLVAGRGRGKL